MRQAREQAIGIDVFLRHKSMSVEVQLRGKILSQSDALSSYL